MSKNSNIKKWSMRLLALFVAILMIYATAFNTRISAAGCSDVSEILLTEENFSEQMETVRTVIDKIETTGYFTGEDSASLYYEKYKVDDAKGAVVICHGFTENLYKYSELIYYFTEMGYSVYTYEQRGHGRSTHLGADETQVNVESFDDYVEDMKTFMETIVYPDNTDDCKYYLFAHSMGGLVGTLFIEKYTDYFDAAILNSPMLGINSGKYPEFFAKLVAFGASSFGFGDNYILGQGVYNPETAYDFDGSGTSSVNRYEYFFGIKNSTKCFNMVGGSYRWLYQAYVGTGKATNYFNARKISIPVILFQAGNDTYVQTDEQTKFAGYVKDCELVTFDNAKHEIYIEKDEIINEYMPRLFNFLDEH